jgi:acetoin:2,6-dichlorophenolindophenol oxidoreductase subunit beta
MPSYLETVNRLLIAESARHPGLVQFGENIAQGSRLCGLARQLPGRVLTVGNCENTHVGVGLGMMMEGGEALLIVKQLDFLLLAADQMINTMNLVRASSGGEGPPGSFTILTIVCDQGWQGPQSSFNDLAGLCALARLDGYHINGAADAQGVFERHLVAPGFRIVAVSQRRFAEECLELPILHGSGNEGELQYADGPDATIVSLGFTLPAALELMARFRAHSRRTALFQLNPVLPHRWPRASASAARTRRLIVLDDAKGAVSLAHKVASGVLRAAPECHVSLHTREQGGEWAVNEDRFIEAEAAA